MDEPFGAVDPIVRERLQEEFLRLQRDVRKTILFVTHDIEEAIRLGDRIAVFSPIGRIEQYAEPATILAAPATDFVANFVGSDRALKRLSVTAVDVANLEQPPVVRPTDQQATAAAQIAACEFDWAAVVDEGQLCGWVAAADVSGDGAVATVVRKRPPSVAAGDSLKVAFSEMLQHDAGWVAVIEQGRYLGVLTPTKVYDALQQEREATQPVPGT